MNTEHSQSPKYWSTSHLLNGAKPLGCTFCTSSLCTECSMVSISTLEMNTWLTFTVLFILLLTVPIFFLASMFFLKQCLLRAPAVKTNLQPLRDQKDHLRLPLYLQLCVFHIKLRLVEFWLEQAVCDSMRPVGHEQHGELELGHKLTCTKIMRTDRVALRFQSSFSSWIGRIRVFAML